MQHGKIKSRAIPTDQPVCVSLDRLEEAGQDPVRVVLCQLRGFDAGIHADTHLHHVLDELGHQRNGRGERQRGSEGEAAGMNGAESRQESGHWSIPPVSE